MNFQKKVTKDNYIRESIIVLNGLLGLTPREIDVLATIIKIDTLWEPRSESEVKNLLSTDSRKIILKDCNINKSNFTKISSKLISMGLLVKSVDGKYIINELLKPTITNNKVEIVFVLNISDGI